MIRGAGSLELAHARLSARLSARPDELAWARVVAVRDLTALLDLARTTALGRWTRGIAPGNDAHAIERALRTHWREEVAEVASWMPATWQRGIAWVATWPDLPVVVHLAETRAAPPWLADDERYRTLVTAEATDRASSRRDDVLRSLGAAALPVARWEQLWRGLLPANADERPIMLALRRAALAYAAALRAPGLTSSTAARQRLQDRLLTLFRRAVLDPAAALAYLALVALDLERLRGELVRRAVFGQALVA